MEVTGAARPSSRSICGDCRLGRAYMERNKTDAADAAALLEAARASDIVPVKVKSIERQALQDLHRTRSLWMATRTARINAPCGFCREFGVVMAVGSRLSLSPKQSIVTGLWWGVHLRGVSPQTRHGMRATPS